ncbi:MAG: 16S rRNA (adenine(1518)-N(6)/adenine(1519)-N(6))-dimethyltransferase RsmA [Parachlamydiaceae bacterium]|nr:16S rRNA (adenine(1518)-N(6)/adenine(1519)-N(6))-dimethyltransferase RsmA [Parachlamydiaceae bacterium]
MHIYKPSELHHFLNELGIAPKKGLSQNFLIDGNIIRKIVAAADVKAGDLVLEIGPGPGSLTQALLEAGAHVVAVEKDTVLAKALERFKTEENHLEVFCDDILTFPLEEHFSEKRPVKVIANLPYHLTTPILVYLISKRHLFSSFTVMVQEEVGRRFAAIPGNKDYGSFTVFLNFYTNPKYAFSVSHHCFFPEPKVDSAVIVLHTKTPPDVDDEEKFFELTRTAFSHRRKMLRASLKFIYDSVSVSDALEKIGLNPLARPEDLSLNDFLKLYDKLRSTKSLT